MKLAFCFLIYDKINHEDVWHEFFKNVTTDKYNIYIHHKGNPKLKYFDKNILENCLKTEWGKSSIVKAQSLLLDTALKDKDNKMFIFLSGSCIPLKSFDYIFSYLNHENKSYFNKAPNSQCFPRCTKTTEYISKKYIKKANMMSILNRKHAQLVVENINTIIKWFDYQQTIPDEHCVITMLHYLGLEDEIITTNNTCYSGSTTFTAWSDMKDYREYKNSIKTNSYTYNHICKEEYIVLVNTPCLFGRKFNIGCSVIDDSDNKNKIPLIEAFKAHVLTL